MGIERVTFHYRDGDGIHAELWRTPACTDACEIRLVWLGPGRKGVVHYDYSQDEHGYYAGVELSTPVLEIEADPERLAEWRVKLGRGVHGPSAVG